MYCNTKAIQATTIPKDWLYIRDRSYKITWLQQK